MMSYLVGLVVDMIDMVGLFGLARIVGLVGHLVFLVALVVDRPLLDGAKIFLFFEAQDGRLCLCLNVVKQWALDKGSNNVQRPR